VVPTRHPGALSVPPTSHCFHLSCLGVRSTSYRLVASGLSPRHFPFSTLGILASWLLLGLASLFGPRSFRLQHRLRRTHCQPLDLSPTVDPYFDPTASHTRRTLVPVFYTRCRRTPKLFCRLSTQGGRSAMDQHCSRAWILGLA
jgi:hypothetical protein